MISHDIQKTLRGWLASVPIASFQDPAPIVSVLRLNGVIGRLSPTVQGLNLETIDRHIKRAFAPYHLAAVALAINSPGGSPVQAGLITRAIRRRAEERGVPVIAFAEDVAASGGYWLATAADEIYADENSIIGSIGVISAGFGFSRLMSKLGIERRVHAKGGRKGMLDPFLDEKPEDIARLGAIQTDIFASFKDQVRARRGEALKAPEDELFNGDIWSGRQAVEMGLIDGIGDLHGIMRERFGDRVRFRTFAPGRSWFARRTGFGAAGKSTGTGRLAGDLIAVLEEQASWRRFGL